MEGHAAYLRTAVGTEFDAAAHALNQARGALEVLAAGKGKKGHSQMEQLEAAVHAAEVRAKRLTILLVAKDSAGGVTVVATTAPMGAGHAPMSIVSTVRAAIGWHVAGAQCMRAPHWSRCSQRCSRRPGRHLMA